MGIVNSDKWHKSRYNRNNRSHGQNANISDAELEIKEYTMFWKERVRQRAGGVILYFRNAISNVEIYKDNMADHNICL